MFSIKRAQPLLGTFVEITATGASFTHVSRAVSSAFTMGRRLEGVLNRFDRQSDVARLNAAAPGSLVQVSPDLVSLLRTSIDLAAQSQGVFNVGIGQNGVCLVDDCHVKITSAVNFDFGGIGKGFIVDQLVQALIVDGVVTGVVNAGGDLRAFGDVSYKVHLRINEHPPCMGAELEIEEMAVATTSNMFRSSGRGCLEVRGVRNELTNKLWNGTKSVTVIASTCTVADALTKIVALTDNVEHPLLQDFGACAYIVSPHSPDTFQSSWHQTNLFSS